MKKLALALMGIIFILLAYLPANIRADDSFDLPLMMVAIHAAASSPRIAPEKSFDWYLGDGLTPADSFSATVVDLDAFTTSRTVIDALHRKGKKVIAYVSVGSWEDWRPDKKNFPSQVIGKAYPGWAGERFLDIRQIKLLAPVIQARFDMIRNKGFDGIEPDNIDSYSFDEGGANGTGFNLSQEDAKRWSSFLIQEAHKRRLSIGQKNAPGLVAEFVSQFDWILTEDAFAQGWQNDVSAYIQNNKAVFAAEYTDMMSQQQFLTTVCPAAKALKYTAILKKRELDRWVKACP